MLNAVLLILLLSIIVGALVKRKHYALMTALLVALVLTASFYVPFCIEYSTTYLVLFVVLLIILKINTDAEEKLYKLFFVTGMVTVFFDFLTTETLTLTLPLIFILCLWKEEGRLRGYKKDALFALKGAMLWGIGYTLTWSSKWCLSTLILHENIFRQAVGSMDERTLGDGNLNLLSQIVQAIIRNIGLIFPMSIAKRTAGVICILLIVSILISGISIVYGRKKNDKGYTLLMCTIGCIPYVRYIILSNHAYLHHFFTYRAQLTLVMVLVYLFIKRIDFHLIKGKYYKRAG